MPANQPPDTSTNRPSGIQRMLKLNYATPEDKEKVWLTQQNTLRILVGILGVSLPLLLFLTLLIDSGYTSPLYSISHYYFTRACSIFVITVSLLAFFLLIYKGKAPIDFILSSLAGVFALALLVFPTGNLSNSCPDPKKTISLTILNISEFRPHFHYISAAIFLTSLSAMSLFVFTKTDKPSWAAMGRNKRRRNRIYITTGIIMILAILVILANFFAIIPDDVFAKYHLTFWMETVAVESFGVSWLIKAEVILKG